MIKNLYNLQYRNNQVVLNQSNFSYSCLLHKGTYEERSKTISSATNQYTLKSNQTKDFSVASSYNLSEEQRYNMNPGLPMNAILNTSVQKSSVPRKALNMLVTNTGQISQTQLRVSAEQIVIRNPGMSRQERSTTDSPVEQTMDYKFTSESMFSSKTQFTKRIQINPVSIKVWSSNLEKPDIDEYSQPLRDAFLPLLEQENNELKCGALRIARLTGREHLQRIVLRANRFELNWSSHTNRPFLLNIHVLCLAHDSCHV